MNDKKKKKKPKNYIIAHLTRKVSKFGLNLINAKLGFSILPRLINVDFVFLLLILKISTHGKIKSAIISATKCKLQVDYRPGISSMLQF